MLRRKQPVVVSILTDCNRFFNISVYIIAGKMISVKSHPIPLYYRLHDQ